MREAGADVKTELGGGEGHLPYSERRGFTIESIHALSRIHHRLRGRPEKRIRKEAMGARRGGFEESWTGSGKEVP